MTLALGGLFAAAAFFVGAQSYEDMVLVEEAVDRDLYLAGRTVSVRARVDGDIVAAGQRVSVDSEVTGDVIAAAQTVEIRSPVGDDVRASGQHIRVSAPVAGHMVVAGQTVKLTDSVGDWAWLAGDTIEVTGDVGGDLEIRARKVAINGMVNGVVTVTGDVLVIGPETVVEGDLRWDGNNAPEVSPNARIEGELLEAPFPDDEDGFDLVGKLMFTLSIIVAVVVFYLLFARPLRASVDRIASHPAMSAMLGFVIMVATPIVAIILTFTTLGRWIGLAMLGSYAVILLLGVLTGLFAVGQLALRRVYPVPNRVQVLAASVVAVVVVGLLSFVPWVGAIAVIGIWLLGVGALCWNTWVALQNAGPGAPQAT